MPPPPGRPAEVGKKEVDVVTIPNRDQTIVHEPKDQGRPHQIPGETNTLPLRLRLRRDVRQRARLQVSHWFGGRGRGRDGGHRSGGGSPDWGGGSHGTGEGGGGVTVTAMWCVLMA